ncbi:MerR family transcriptional regulator [Deferribacterales bacterium Es71-Z0220]|uniref:MerR family transcriptional regulator n=1 Tax=Deferrivibrio essentukiensis TaxID=2880922 RepID=UPI001F623CF2|nr:MerR family transcriptional regulator [Deferrivibrio essentukiensis]MCB4204177.1 MerR family transcriptional regulator [Deferrivibrio essentukiensis]
MHSNKIYYKISEVCEITDLKPSVLRFWEKEFKEIRPFKTTSKRRLYTQKNIEAINKIKDLLYNKRMTIEGAKRFLKEENVSEPSSKELDLEFLKEELSEIVKKLREI